MITFDRSSPHITSDTILRLGYSISSQIAREKSTNISGLLSRSYSSYSATPSLQHLPPTHIDTNSQYIIHHDGSFVSPLPLDTGCPSTLLHHHSSSFDGTRNLITSGAHDPIGSFFRLCALSWISFRLLSHVFSNRVLPPTQRRIPEFQPLAALHRARASQALAIKRFAYRHEGSATRRRVHQLRA